MLFHFQIENSLSNHKKKKMAIQSQRVVESLIVDFLCLDNTKALIKVPLCALRHLEQAPHALNQLFLKRGAFVNSSQQFFNTLKTSQSKPII